MRRGKALDCCCGVVERAGITLFLFVLFFNPAAAMIRNIYNLYNPNFALMSSTGRFYYAFLPLMYHASNVTSDKFIII
jgi:hypothetical protein